MKIFSAIVSATVFFCLTNSAMAICGFAQVRCKVDGALQCVTPSRCDASSAGSFEFQPDPTTKVTVTGVVTKMGLDSGSYYDQAEAKAKKIAQQKCNSESVTQVSEWKTWTSHPQGNTYGVWYFNAQATFQCSGL